MYRIAYLLVGLAGISLMPVVLAEDAFQAGGKLAQRVYDRPDGQDASTRGIMSLVEKGSPPRVRQMYTYRLDRGNQTIWSMIRFVSPPDVNGVGLLTYDYPGDESDQWLYLTELDSSRRIASNRKGGRFVGSDLFYEDLRDREVSMDRHRIIGREQMMGAECDLLESIPVNPDNSVYSKRVSWIHPGTLIPLRVELIMGDKPEPVKRLQVHRIEKIQGYWTVMESTMTDLESNHITIMKAEHVVYDRHLPEELFSQKTLEDPAREEKFRP